MFDGDAIEGACVGVAALLFMAAAALMLVRCWP